MKRIAFILVSCVVSLWTMAQTVLWDGEDASITGRNANGGFWDRCNPSVVDNPDKSGINKSNKCLKFTMTGNDSGQREVACPFRDWMTLNLNGRRRVSLMIRKTTSENVKVQLSDPTNGADNYWQNAAAWYSGGGKWQKLVFDFSTHTGLNDYPGVIAITGQTGNVTTAEDVWIDNIVVEDLPAVNGTPLKDVAAGTLTGPLTLTGFWSKGESLNLDNDWAKVEYDDFDLLAGKMTSNVTSVDMRGATVQNAYNVFAAVNPNMLIYANQWFAVAGDDYAYIATGEDNPVIYYKPAGNYVGDPMPCYIDGEFKVLYLFEKPQNGETYHPFHMVTSSDLSSFTEQGEVLPTGGANSWDAAPGTGCMVKKDDTYYIFYTGNYTTGAPDNYRQQVLRATSTDGIHWTKDGSWHMQAPADGWHKNEFRDPQVWEEDGTWHMVLGAMKWNGSANMPVVAEYTSTDLTTWAGPTVVVEGNNPANFYECPDVFKIGDRTYLVYSEINGSDRKVHYLYKPNGASAWTVPAVDVLDGQGFYAGKTAYDGYDRYIFGWCDRRAGNINENGLAWGGTLVTHKLYEKAPDMLALTVPHTFLTNFGTVRTLKTRETTGTVIPSGGTYTMEASSSLSFGRLKQKNEIKATFTASGKTNEIFGFSFVDNSDKDAVYTLRINLHDQKIYYNKDNRSGGVSEINQVPLPRSANGVYNIRIYNDQSVCVLYVNDEVAFTNRIYGMPQNPWKIICEQGSVTVQNLVWKTN